MQKFWKSVKVWQSYREFKGGNVFETQCSYGCVIASQKFETICLVNHLGEFCQIYDFDALGTNINWLDFEVKRSKNQGRNKTWGQKWGRLLLLGAFCHHRTFNCDNLVDLDVLWVVLQLWAKWSQKVKGQGWGHELTIHGQKSRGLPNDDYPSNSV